MFREGALRREGTDSSRPQTDLLTQNIQCPSVQSAALRYSKHTHTPCCVLSLCLVLKSPGNAPPLKLLRSPSMPCSVSPALGLELLWPIWIQLEPHYRNVHILSLWACKTFCLYYNAPQNALLAVIGSLAKLQIMNKINNVSIHPRHSLTCSAE